MAVSARKVDTTAESCTESGPGTEPAGSSLQRGAFDQGTKDGAWERWDAQGNHLDTTWWKQGRKLKPKG